MSASEWIAVPGAAGAAVLPTTDARPKALDPDFERRIEQAPPDYGATLKASVAESYHEAAVRIVADRRGPWI
jgi:hypothetical protein